MAINALVVDDERSLLEQAEIFLGRLDQEIEVHTTISVDEALEMLDEDEFDIIVSDYQMPGKDGIEFLKILREERNDDIPFIMLTARGREEVAMKALNLGANRYLLKVGEPEPWYDVLGQAIEQEIKQYRAEERWKETEERYRRLFESTQDGIIILDSETSKIEDANPFLEELLGYSEEELVGKELWDIDIFKNIVDSREELEKLIEEGYIQFQDIDLETKQGRKVPVEIVFNTYLAGGRKVVQCRIIDISERRRRKSLEEGVMRFRKLSEASPNAIMLVNKETRNIKDVNRVAETLLDLERKNIIGREYLEFHPEEEKRDIRSIFDRLENGDVTSSKEFHIKNSEGEEIPVQMRASSLKLGGEEIIYFALNDITKRKEAEKREEFLHSLLRHDVGNKIQVIQGYIQHLGDEEKDEELLDMINRAEKVSKDTKDLIEKVRTLRDVEDQEEVETLDISSTLKSMVSTYRKRLEDTEIKLERERKEMMVKGGPLLNEIFSNILENTIQHAECDEIRIKIEDREKNVNVRIEDNGKGIPDDFKEDLFKKGYKKGDSAGSGLGLYLVKEITESYGGGVEIKDSDIGGARFDVYLQKI